MPTAGAGAGAGAGTQGVLRYTLTTSDEALCAPAPGSNVSHVQYTGALCGGKNIAWTSMATVDPRANKAKTGVCAWSVQDNPADIEAYLGTCGVGATKVLLPIQVC